MRKLVALTLLVLLIPAAQAAADDYYVTQAGGGSCAQDSPCTLNEALLGADATLDILDTIHVIGALGRNTPVNLSNSPIELIGSGAVSGGTFINVTSGSAVFVGPESTVRAVSARSGDFRAFEMAAGATLIDVQAETAVNDSTVGAIQVLTTGATTHITNANVIASGATGLLANAPFELVHSTVSAQTGVRASNTAVTSRIERSKITASSLGVWARVAPLDVASSVILTSGGLDRGILVDGRPSSSPPAPVSVRGSTIVHTSAPAGGNSGVGAAGDDETINIVRAEVTVRDSIVRGYENDLRTFTVSGPGHIVVDHSDFHNTFGGGIEADGSNVDLDPHWLDPAMGNYGLAADSPVIDIGGAGALEAIEASTDFAGLARLLDGNGDGVPARDMGAFEYPAPVANFTATPDPATVGQPVTFDGSGSTYTRGDITRYEWDLDGNGSFEVDQGPATITKTYTEPGTVTVALRVTGPDGGRGRATRTITVQAAGGPGPGPGPGPGADVTAPLMKLGAGTLVLGKSRVLKVKLTCAATEPETCAGPLRLERLNKLKLASKRFSIKPGRTVAVKLKLSKAKVKLIKKRKVKKVRAVATPRDKAGNSKPYKRTYRLKRATRLRPARR